MENPDPKSSFVPKRFPLSLVDELARFNQSHTQEEREPPQHLLCPILAPRNILPWPLISQATTLSANAFSLGSGSD